MTYYKYKGNISSYDFADFKKACKNNKDNIYIPDNVLADADKYFNLRSRKQILDFIYNDGLENLIFDNNKLWEKNRNKTKPIMIDSYEFKSLGKRGYIAFMYNDETNKWTIKSFHLSKNMNETMSNAIKRADIIKKFKLEGKYE